MRIKKTQILLLMGLVAVVVWLFRSGPSAVNVSNVHLTVHPVTAQAFPVTASSAPLFFNGAAFRTTLVEPQEVYEKSAREDLLSAEVAEDPILARSAVEAAEELMHLIPGWLLEFGDVHRERVQVAGLFIDRVRSRYTWPNGSRLEVEVTDFGKRATREHFKSLGFDFGLEAEVTNRTLRALIDGDDYFSNLEYSEEDWSGYVQYIVDGRYLMELQLERLPFESFQTLEDRDGLFRTLLQYVSK